MTDILIIDDDAELSRMLGEYLADEGFTVTTSGNGHDGADLALSGRFAAVILDIMLPRINGIEVLRRLRQESDIPVIMLTARGDDVDRVVGLELGADDYIAKPYYPRELVARLRAVLRRMGTTRTTAPLSRGALLLDPARRATLWEGRPVDLTATEFNLLEALLRAGPAVATKEELSLTALGRTRQRYDRSIDVHVSNLRQKLARASGGAIEIETIRGVGYRLTARP
ncbi:MAG: response regulator transcription factor [Hyphomonadaceae bacterium]